MRASTPWQCAAACCRANGAAPGSLRFSQRGCGVRVWLRMPATAAWSLGRGQQRTALLARQGAHSRDAAGRAHQGRTLAGGTFTVPAAKELSLVPARTRCRLSVTAAAMGG